MGNWVDISEQMTTKSLEEIKQHYLKYYIEPQSFPLPVKFFLFSFSIFHFSFFFSFS